MKKRKVSQGFWGGKRRQKDNLPTSCLGLLWIYTVTHHFTAVLINHFIAQIEEEKHCEGADEKAFSFARWKREGDYSEELFLDKEGEWIYKARAFPHLSKLSGLPWNQGSCCHSQERLLLKVANGSLCFNLYNTWNSGKYTQSKQRLLRFLGLSLLLVTPSFLQSCGLDLTLELYWGRTGHTSLQVGFLLTNWPIQLEKNLLKIYVLKSPMTKILWDSGIGWNTKVLHK